MKAREIRVGGVLFAVCLSLLLAACAPASTPASPSPTPVVSAPTAAAPTPTVIPPLGPKYGGRLTFGTTSDVTGFDPFVSIFENYLSFLQLYDPLIYQDKGRELHPMLAESWRVSEDGLTLTFELHEGVKFHSGQEFTSADVVANFERTKSSETGGHLYTFMDPVESMQALDEYTVEVRLKHVTPNIWDIMSWLFYMIDPGSFDTVSEGGVGTGPFRFKEWIPGDHITLVRNEDYWGEGLPYLDEVVFKPFGDADAMVAALEAGTIDAAWLVPHKDYDRLKGTLNIEPDGTGFLMYILILNPPDPGMPETPFSHKEVRQAFSWAFDRQTVVEQALYGVGEAYVLPYAKGSPAYFADLDASYSFDLDRAKELITEAGYPDGFDITCMALAAEEPMVAMMQILQADLATIGVDMEIEALEQSIWIRKLLDGDYDCTISSVASTKDPLTLFINSPYRPFNSPIFPEGDFPEGYVENIEIASSTIDSKVREEAFRRIDEILLEEVWNMGVATSETLIAWQPWVHGLDWSINVEPVLAGAWVDR